ncbi:hypothetical protein C8R47DRAFT_1219477 [Mycena vitilis]|nr:hypothetical protein C8R47DRAFT_1219477 [Mycena vitilis]
MVAVNPRRLTLLACSIASLSLSPSADAAAVPGVVRSTPSSPTKQHARQQPPTMPMPMKRLFAKEEGATANASPSVKSSRRSQDPQGEVVSNGQQAQTRFHIRRRMEAREDTAGSPAPGTPGYVGIRDSANSTKGYLLFNPLTSTLESSTNNMTTLNAVYPDPGHCKLQMLMPNATEPYCATYDPMPPKPEPMRMTPCTNTSAVNSTQLFACDSGTGVVAPMWTTDKNATAPATTGTLNSRDAATENVTLVFVPSAPNAAAAQAVSPDSASASATTTVTTTVTATATPSFAAAEVNAPSSSITASDAQSTSSASSMSASPSIAAQQVDAASSSMTDPSSSATDSLSQPTSSASVTASSSAPATSSPVGALAVEMAAPSSTMSVVPSSSSAPSFSSAVSSMSADPSASSSSPASAAPSSTPIDAAAQADDSVSSSGAPSASSSACSMSGVPSSASSSSSAASATPVDAAAQADDSPSSMSSVLSASASSSVSSAVSATPSAVNASAVADNIVASNASASATASASSSASAAPSAAPPTSNEQAVFGANQGRGQPTAQWRRA